MGNVLPETIASPRYEVMVTDMFQYGEEPLGHLAGTYDNLQDAILACVQITLASLNKVYETTAKPEACTAEILRNGWFSLGSDPWILGPGSGVPFSARNFMTDGLLNAIIELRKHHALH